MTGPAQMRLPAAMWSPRIARRFVAARLTEQLSPGDHEIVASAALVTSELVTNAVLHAHSGVRVSVACEADRVVVEVADRGSGGLTASSPPPGAESGRGLQLVQRLSSAWGVDIRDGERAVWCAFQRS